MICRTLFFALLFSSCSTPQQGGRVTFSGFPQAALSDFRVIPEHGNRLRIPRNETTYYTDGLFWRHAAYGHWYKIPNHCHSQLQPRGEDFTDSPECDPAGMVIQKLRNQPERPTFVPQRGATGHPLKNPFAAPRSAW